MAPASSTIVSDDGIFKQRYYDAAGDDSGTLSDSQPH